MALSLSDIRLGDVVRLRNGDTLTVASKCERYGDRTGEHVGPFVSDRALSHFLLADVTEVVSRNERACVFCGEGVTSKNPECDFCSYCFYSCRNDERDFADLVAKLRALPDVTEVGFWHTGGGCKLLAVNLASGRLVTISNEAELPEPGDAWHLAVVWPSEEAYDEQEYEHATDHDGEWTDDELVAYVSEIEARP